MRKSTRRINAMLDAAREYVSSYTSKQSKDAKQVAHQTIQSTRTDKRREVEIESAEIIKLEKGHFYVILTFKGKKHKIEKRFKSTTKAREWILKHEYIEPEALLQSFGVTAAKAAVKPEDPEAKKASSSMDEYVESTFNT